MVEFTGEWKAACIDMKHFQNLERREEKKSFFFLLKKILGGTTETITLFTCYKNKLDFSKYEKCTPYAGI